MTLTIIATTIWLFICLLIIAVVCFKTYKSSFSRDRKIVLYVITAIMPILGLIFYVIFSRYQAQKTSGMVIR
jgi:membrane protein DedA with SNARE-associated domain